MNFIDRITKIIKILLFGYMAAILTMVDNLNNTAGTPFHVGAAVFVFSTAFTLGLLAAMSIWANEKFRGDQDE